MEFRHWNGKTIISLASAIERRIVEYDGGATERAYDTAHNAANTVARLIEMLHDRNILSDKDALEFTEYGLERIS